MAYEWQVAWRYLLGARTGRRNGFIAFISGVSMLGIALGVAALIVVLSVVNGFSREVRDRMLSAVPHVQLGDARGGVLADWAGTAQRLQALPGVQGVAPFAQAGVLLGRGDELRPAVLRGIDPALEGAVSPLARGAAAPALAGLRPGERQVLLGVALAKRLGVAVGQPVTLVLAAEPGRPGTAVRLVSLTVAGTLDAGHFEIDNSLAWMLLADVEALYGLSGPTGLQLQLADRDDAPRAAAAVRELLGPGVVVGDWTQTNRQWFESVQIQKRMLGLILVLIVAVAAFNLVATLVMTVTDKRSDIAILRTLGASPGSVMKIFMAQGLAAGVVGTAAGVAIGLAIAFNIDTLVPAIERLLNTRLLSSDIYLIDRLPSDPQRGDVLPIIVASLLLSLAATLYPSWRASRLQPAEALRHE